MQLVVALKREQIQQYGHDAPVVMTIGGARHQLHLVFVSFIRLYFFNQVFERSLADRREDHVLYRALWLPGPNPSSFPIGSNSRG